MGVAADTVRRGRSETEDLDAATVVASRRPGGGRKRAEVHDPGLVAALEALIDPVTRGDPMSPLRWTLKSTRALARALTEQGHRVSDYVVRRLLHEQGYSLQANAKTTEGGQHPDRDAQFGHLNDQVRQHMDAGNPVISVDTKKKELVGAPTRTAGGNGHRPGPRSRSRSTTSSTRHWARPIPMASTTSLPTPVGCRWAPTTTPPSSP
ncbi:mobile element protein [Pseudonocardia sp. N23]|nr:mobile element protein [Pseudonocardia sp. N23]